jgi:hypothetical protein
MTDVTLRTDSAETLTSRRRWRRRNADGFELDSRRSRLKTVTDPSSLIPTYAGVLVILVGFALIGIAWARVAGLVDVWRQMPYVLSAGLPGLGLVMTGLVIVNVSARRQDGAARARQLDVLTEAMRDLQRSLDR